MAKVTGVFKVFGTIHGVTLYQMEGTHLARAAKDIPKQRYKTGKNYASFRAAGKEMGHSAKMSKFFRWDLVPYTHGISENRMYSRVNALMRQLVGCDPVSALGERKVAQGLATDAGRALLAGFEFNSHLSLSQVLYRGYELDVVAGRFTMADFSSKASLNWPVGATHVGFRLLHYGVAFAEGRAEMRASSEVVLPQQDAAVDLVLETEPLTMTEGTELYMLRVLFYQELNGGFYALRGTDCGVVSVLRVV